MRKDVVVEVSAVDCACLEACRGCAEEGPCRRHEYRRGKVLVDKGFQLVVAGISRRYTSNRSQKQGQSSNLEESQNDFNVTRSTPSRAR